MRIVEAIERQGYTGTATSPQLKVEKAGYDGFLPSLAAVLDGNNFEMWIQNSAYVSNNLVPVVVRTPKMFDILKDEALGNRLRNLYIAVMTRLPLTITGLKATVTLDTVEHRVGAAGEMHEEFSKANRERSTVNKTYNEKLGKVLNRFFDFLLRYGVRDPDTQSPLITTLELSDGSIAKGELYTADFYTGTMLYYEPDVVNKNVVEAFLCFNMANKTAGEVVASRDLSSGGELREYSIDFTAITQSGESVRAGAQLILDKMSIFDKNPDRDLPLGIHDTELATALSNEFSFNDGSVDAITTTPSDIKSAFNA